MLVPRPRDPGLQPDYRQSATPRFSYLQKAGNGCDATQSVPFSSLSRLAALPHRRHRMMLTFGTTGLAAATDACNDPMSLVAQDRARGAR